ncbi:MAG: hypothetical protein ACMUIP_03750 [bacterium]
MNKYGNKFAISFIIVVFLICICIPIISMAQGTTILPPVPVPTAGTSWVTATVNYLPVPLPTWSLNPWGATSGTGNAAIPAYTIYNATVLGGLVPFAPLPPVPPPLPFSPSPLMIPPVPAIRGAATTTTIALPSPIVAPVLAPVAPAPLITTTQLFLGLLLRIGEESGLFATNPALFWYIVGLLY